MRCFLVVFSILACFSHTQAQNNIPLFETTIYIKDAVGNIDSIEYGFDPDDIPNDTAQFHEVLDNSPFDSILDIRLILRHFDPEVISNLPMYKRLINTSYNPGWCELGGDGLMLIHAKYQPVTFYWDREAFKNLPCTSDSYFTPDVYSELVEPWLWVANPNTVAWCASSQDSMTLFLYNHFISYPDGSGGFGPYWGYREVEGIGTDTVVGVSITIEYYHNLSPCQYVVDTEQPSLPFEPVHALRVSPTIGNGSFSVWNDRSVDLDAINVFDIAGHKVQSQHGNGSPQIISMEGYSPGMYVIYARWKDGFTGFAKIIVGRN